MRGARRIGLMLAASLSLAACGSAASVAPTPTPVSVLGQQYLKAADKANTALDAINSRLLQDCKTLDPCKKDFADYSKIENTFVTELRGIKVPASMEADLRAVLDVERRLIGLDDDAAQAASLDQINTDYSASRALDNQFGDAVDHLRLDLKLPAAPSLSPNATPSATASA
jgi:hypothetical protein